MAVTVNSYVMMTVAFAVEARYSLGHLGWLVNPSIPVVVGVRTMTTIRIGAAAQNCRAFSQLTDSYHSAKHITDQILHTHFLRANNPFAFVFVDPECFIGSRFQPVNPACRRRPSPLVRWARKS